MVELGQGEEAHRRWGRWRWWGEAKRAVAAGTRICPSARDGTVGDGEGKGTRVEEENISTFFFHFWQPK